MLITSDERWVDLVQCIKARQYYEETNRQVLDECRDDHQQIDMLKDDFLMAHLQQWDLPYTPATVACLRAALEGKPAPPPTRGLLVTTRIAVRMRHIGDSDPRRIAVGFQPNPDVSIEGGLEWATGPLFDQAKKIALTHQQWVRNRPSYPVLADVGAMRKVQAYSFASSSADAELCIDYFAEAVADADAIAMLADSADRNVDGEISKYLDRVQVRVSKRRRRSAIEPTPEDPQWREKARVAIRDKIRASRTGR